MNRIRSLSIAAALVSALGIAHADPIYSVNFESGITGADFSQNSYGVSAVDPLNSSNHVVKFTAVKGGGDLFSRYMGGTGTYTLSFDVLGTCASGNCGAFIGTNDANGEHWLAGDASYSTPHLMKTTGVWQHVSFTFSATGAFRLELEDYSSFDNVAGDIYFDNICVSADNSCAAATATSVPEPGSLALAGLALAALGLARRRG